MNEVALELENTRICNMQEAEKEERLEQGGTGHHGNRKMLLR